jgi:hypothetical protein
MLRKDLISAVVYVLAEIIVSLVLAVRASVILLFGLAAAAAVLKQLAAIVVGETTAQAA